MFSRSTALLGEKSMALLQSKRVILFGIGGVGSWCAECLIRTGLKHLTIVDGDTVQASNLNRQLPATQATLGMPSPQGSPLGDQSKCRDRGDIYNVQCTMYKGGSLRFVAI